MDACAIEGCESPVKARARCGRHYSAWRKQAAPGEVGEYLRAPDSCGVEDCEREPRTKGYCSLHYKRWVKHGTPEPRFRGQVVDGKRICPKCREDLPLSEWGAARCCKACNRANARKYLVPADRLAAICKICGVEFQGTKRQRSTCSEECRLLYKAVTDSDYQKANIEKAREAKRRWQTANPDKVAEKEQRRRARKRGATVGPIDLDALWTGLCGICDDPMDRDLRWPDLLSRSLDHIHPLSNGGVHTQANLQYAHLICNIRKGDRVGTEVSAR